MKQGIVAELMLQTALESTGLAVHPRSRRQGWRWVATAAVALAGLVAGLSPATATAAEAPVPVLD
jgi:hypothetical protein